jgi:hypothetical protein
MVIILGRDRLLVKLASLEAESAFLRKIAAANEDGMPSYYIDDEMARVAEIARLKFALAKSKGSA